MAQSRDQRLWNAVKPVAARDGVQPVDVPAVETRAETRATAIVAAVKAELLQSQADRVAQLTTLLAGKAPLVHTQAIATIIGLQAALTALQTRLAALEAKVP